MVVQCKGASFSGAHTAWEQRHGGFAAGHGALRPVMLQDLRCPAALPSAALRHFEPALLKPRQVMDSSTCIKHIVPNDVQY